MNRIFLLFILCFSLSKINGMQRGSINWGKINHCQTIEEEQEDRSLESPFEQNQQKDIVHGSRVLLIAALEQEKQNERLKKMEALRSKSHYDLSQTMSPEDMATIVQQQKEFDEK